MTNTNEKKAYCTCSDHTFGFNRVCLQKLSRGLSLAKTLRRVSLAVVEFAFSFQDRRPTRNHVNVKRNYQEQLGAQLSNRKTLERDTTAPPPTPILNLFFSTVARPPSFFTKHVRPMSLNASRIKSLGEKLLYLLLSRLSTF